MRKIYQNVYCCIATLPTTWISILLVGRMNTKVIATLFDDTFCVHL